MRHHLVAEVLLSLAHLHHPLLRLPGAGVLLPKPAAHRLRPRGGRGLRGQGGGGVHRVAKVRVARAYRTVVAVLRQEYSTYIVLAYIEELVYMKYICCIVSF